VILYWTEEYVASVFKERNHFYKQVTKKVPSPIYGRDEKMEPDLGKHEW
jgi:hypothetical protein